MDEAILQYAIGAGIQERVDIHVAMTAPQPILRNDVLVEFAGHDQIECRGQPQGKGNIRRCVGYRLLYQRVCEGIGIRVSTLVNLFLQKWWKIFHGILPIN